MVLKCVDHWNVIKTKNVNAEIVPDEYNVVSKRKNISTLLTSLLEDKFW